MRMLMNKPIILAVFVISLLLSAHCSDVIADDASSQLWAAIKSGDAAKVGDLLSSGTDPNSKIRDDITALMASALYGHAEIVKLLLDKGAKVNAKTGKRVTALIVAAGRGNPEVAKLLLDRGADANIHVQGGATAFEVAAVKGHEEVAEMLRKRTKGAADARLKTTIGPLEEGQKGLAVRRSPDEASETVVYLKPGVEINIAGESGDGKYALLQKPVEGWVPKTGIKKVWSNTAHNGGHEQVVVHSCSGIDINAKDMLTVPPGPVGEYWRR
jgi:uncharacterized protein